MRDLVIFLALGGVIGSLSGALGIGGGVLMVPALVWLCDFDYRKAAGTSLAVLALPVLLPAAWKYHSEKHVDVIAAAFIALAFAGGAYLGAGVVKHVPEHWLRFGFGLMMIYVAVRLMIASDSHVAAAAAGLLSAAAAWLAYLGLRLLGRRHLPKPELAKQIRAMGEQAQDQTEYYI